ncbi:MAG: hypothetical protein JWN72_231, partial [Thermoleophilia bacterium]|nr:hypothetical protein [Thermoleophilia bacterium]
ATVHGVAHLACIEFTEPRALDVVAGLAAQGTSIRALSASRVRVSLGCWNTPDEVAHCGGGIADALRSPD